MLTLQSDVSIAEKPAPNNPDLAFVRSEIAHTSLVKADFTCEVQEP